MDLQEHKNEFDKIVKKYKLFEEKKAKEISDYLINKTKISHDDFLKVFNFTKEETEIFLNFIEKGIRFKEDHIDKSKK